VCKQLLVSESLPVGDGFREWECSAVKFAFVHKWHGRRDIDIFEHNDKLRASVQGPAEESCDSDIRSTRDFCAESEEESKEETEEVTKEPAISFAVTRGGFKSALNNRRSAIRIITCMRDSSRPRGVIGD